MAGAGGLVALLLNITSHVGQAIVIAVVGMLMIVYVLVGGMKGTTWVQIIKAVLLIGGAASDDGDGAGQVRGELLRDARRRADRGLRIRRQGGRQARRAGARRAVRRAR